MIKFNWGFPWFIANNKLEKKKQRREREKFLKEIEITDSPIRYSDPSEDAGLSPPLGELFFLDINTDGDDDIS